MSLAGGPWPLRYFTTEMLRSVLVRARVKAFLVTCATVSATSSGCHRSPSPPVPAASASSGARLEPLVDTSSWIDLDQVAGERGPLALLTGPALSCLDARGCPFEPVRLPPCGAGVSALGVSEVRARASAEKAIQGRVRVRGRLALHESRGIVACPGDPTPRLSAVKLPHEVDRPCCNHGCGTFVLRDPANRPGTDLLLTTARGEIDIGKALRATASCGGDESALCCPLPPDSPVVVEAEPVVLGERMAPYSVILSAVRLCTESSTKQVAKVAPRSCANGVFTYRDGTLIEHPSRCALCRCAAGAWEPVVREKCFPIRLNEPADIARAEREVRRSVDHGGLLGPYFVRPLAAADPAKVRAIRQRLLRGAGVEPFFLHEEPLPVSTGPWPAPCAPPAGLVAEVWIGREWPPPVEPDTPRVLRP